MTNTVGGEAGKRATVARERQVTEHTRIISSSLDRLATGVSKLQEQLCMVLREEPPKDEIAKQDEQALVSLAEELQVNHKTIDRISDQIYSMLDRLEL